MAVAVVMDFEHATLAQYDQLIERMGLQPEGPGPSGALFHFVAARGEGIRVVDVWVDKASFERFAEDQIGPNAQAVGIEGEPTISHVDVHSYLTGG